MNMGEKEKKNTTTARTVTIMKLYLLINWARFIKHLHSLVIIRPNTALCCCDRGRYWADKSLVHQANENPHLWF